MAFTENLRRLRLERFLSQAELARRAGLHALTVTRLEAGTTAPSTRTVRALAEAMAVEPRGLASPNEGAELRRGFGAARTEDQVGYLDPWDRERGAGLTEHSTQTD